MLVDLIKQFLGAFMANDPVLNSTDNTDSHNSQENTDSNIENVSPVSDVETSADVTTATEATTEATPADVAPVENVAEEATKTEEVKPAHESTTDPGTMERLNKIYADLKQFKENDGSIEVEVSARIRGGLRVMYDIMPLFLPASHFNLGKSPSEEEINAAVGTKIIVKIHELAEDESGRKTVIVSRKSHLESAIWDKFNEGDTVEGTVSSIATFGIFLDLGGVEGLIHISRLSPVHVGNPRNFAKIGDKMQAKIIKIDKDKRRIGLSHQEFVASPWKGLAEQYPDGSKITGKVKRITDFGAYIEIKPGVDGLLRTNEISWTKRIAKASDVLQVGKEIEVSISNINEDKQTATLSIKRLTDNPWVTFKNNNPEGTELKGKVVQIKDQGCLVRIQGDMEIDGFMPKSKARPILNGNNFPYELGQEIDVNVVDVLISDESLILAPVMEDAVVADFENSRQKARAPKPQQRKPAPAKKHDAEVEEASSGSFSFGDLLSDKSIDKLKNLGN